MANMANICCGIEYVLVDAFTGPGLKGNPAAVCIVDPGTDSSLMQQVAAEINVSQTAFLVKNTSKEKRDDSFDYELRWFAPRFEVALCGHGTLASAYYLFVTDLVDSDAVIRFKTQSGVLNTRKIATTTSQGFEVEMELPFMHTSPCEDFPSLPQTIGDTTIVAVSRSARGDLILELETEETVRGIMPNFDEILGFCDHGLLITARANSISKYDFVTRYFAPRFGINEDPVCGSAHCALAPYWAKKLQKNTLCAHQISERGGRLGLQVDWDKMSVLMSGEAAFVKNH